MFLISSSLAGGGKDLYFLSPIFIYDVSLIQLPGNQKFKVHIVLCTTSHIRRATLFLCDTYAQSNLNFF